MTAPDLPALLEPIQERLDAATPGPWHLDRDEPGDVASVVAYAHNDGVTIGTYVADTVEEDGDAAFIANAPTDTARLLAAVKAVAALHKPERGVVYDPDDGETREMEYCETCSDSQWLDEATAVAWPCLTVSAVEAALGEA